MYSIKDLVNEQLCTGCGVCISEKSIEGQMKWNENGFLFPDISYGDVERALRVCPFNPIPEKIVEDEDALAEIFLNDSPHSDDHIGHFENTYIGYSEKYRNTSSSGGIATFIFDKLLRGKKVSHIFVVKEVDGSYEYSLFSDIDDLISISKTRYIPVTMEKLFKQIDEIEGSVAVCGVACFIKAIRLKQYYNPEFKKKISFLVGIICGGWKSKFFTDFLAQAANINGDYHNQEYRIKNIHSLSSDYSFGAYDKVDNFHSVQMFTLGDMWGTGLFKSKACEFCTDVTTELADISLGDAWLDEYRKEGLGNNIIITRSKLADDIIANALAVGEINVKKVHKNKIIASQSPSFYHRQNAIYFRANFIHHNLRVKPYYRKRMNRNISIPYMLVQSQREITRKRSIEIWKNKRNITEFNKEMKKSLKYLHWLTKINRKYRAIAKKIGY